MRTDDLIAGLARAAVPVTPSPERLLLRALAVTVPLSLVLMIATIGIRDDAVEALGEGWFAWKLVVVATFVLVGWSLTRSNAGPGRKLSLAGLGLAAVALVAGNVADFASMGAADWPERLFGDNALKCLVTIPLLSLLPLAGVVYALRESAPTQPALAGAAAGLLAGALGAFLYGLHCTDDSPLFLNAWYVAATGLMALAGAVAGRLTLKW